MKSRKIDFMAIGLALFGMTALDATAPAGSRSFVGVRVLSAQERASVPPPRNTWEEESMFVEARRAINGEDFVRAAELFAAIRTNRRSFGRYAPDAYYWEAFTRYRQGDLEEALLLLETVMAGHEEAQRHGRLYADVRNLHLEVQSQLASSGDAGALEQVLRDADAALDPSPTPPRFRVMPMDVGDRRMPIPVGIADLQAYPDSVAVDSAHIDARADATVAGVHAQMNDLAAALRGAAPQLDEAIRAAEYASLAADYDWQAALYQEAAPSRAQAQEGCEDLSVQVAALEAVMRYDEVNRLHVLREVLAREDACARQLHVAAVGLVGRLGTDEAHDVLDQVILGHAERSVRRAALRELWRFDSSDAFTRLRVTLQDSDDVVLRRDAIEGLRKSRFEAGATAIQNALVSAALDQGNDGRLRQTAIYALRSRDDVEAGVFIPIYERLESDDLKQYLLSQMVSKVRAKEDMETAAWARSVAFDAEESSDVRSEAFSAWASHPTVTVAYLRDLYAEISEAFLKRQAIYAIYQRANSDASVPAVLMELIRNETDEEVRERGIYWLGRTESEDAVDFLLELLRPPATDTTARGTATDTIPPPPDRDGRR